MNINLKENWLLLVLLVVAIGTAVYFYNRSAAPAEVVTAKAVIEHPQLPVDTFVDKMGQNHSEIPANTNVISQKALKDSSVKRDSVLNVIDQSINQVDASHLMEVTIENISLRAQILKMKKDSADKSRLLYKDKWLSFYFHPADSTVTDLIHNFTLNNVRYNKIRLFNSNPILDFYADDPRVRITGASHWSVEVPPPLIGATADAKTLYDFKSGHFIPSVGLTFRVGKFQLEGRNYWSVHNQQFQQMVSASYVQPLF